MTPISIARQLPIEYPIPLIEDILYSIGLCDHSVNVKPKRSKVHNPILIAIVIIIQVLFRTLAFLTDDPVKLSLLAELSQYLGVYKYIDIKFIILSLMTLYIQSVYYSNHIRGNTPEFVRVLRMMSGSVTPRSIGLTNERQVRNLLAIGKWFSLFMLNNKIIIPILPMSLAITNYWLGMGFTVSAVMYGTIPLMFSSLWGYYVIQLSNSQMFVFFILSKFLLLKMKALDHSLKINRKHTNIVNVLHSHDLLHREIDDYNSTYWSKFLFSVWLSFGIVIVITFYEAVFLPLTVLLRIMAIYLFISLSFLYFSIINMAASINSHANKSYKILNTFYIDYYRNATKASFRVYRSNLCKVI